MCQETAGSSKMFPSVEVFECCESQSKRTQVYIRWVQHSKGFVSLLRQFSEIIAKKTPSPMRNNNSKTNYSDMFRPNRRTLALTKDSIKLDPLLPYKQHKAENNNQIEECVIRGI